MTAKTKRAAPGKESARQNIIYGANHSTGIDALLSRLDRVRQTGPGRWIASCPTREDKRPSMTIRQLDDGRILMHDFGGETTEAILDAIDMKMTDLFPERIGDHLPRDRRPFPAADVLRAIGFEGLVVASSGVSMLSGKFTEGDRERLVLAVSRIQAGLTAAGVGRHG